MNTQLASPAVSTASKSASDKSPDKSASPIQATEAPSLASSALTPDTTTLEVVTPEVIVESSAMLIIAGNRIPLDEFNRELNKAQSTAGRLKSLAEKKDLGKRLNDMSGGVTRVVTPAIVSVLFRNGDLGDKTSQAAVAQRDKVLALNMILDGLVLLGLAERK